MFLLGGVFGNLILHVFSILVLLKSISLALYKYCILLVSEKNKCNVSDKMIKCDVSDKIVI